MSKPRPTIGITMGDPLGIGPEVVVRTLADPRYARTARIVIYGQNQVLAWNAERLRMEPDWYRVAHDSDRASQPIVTDTVVLDFPEFEFALGALPGPSRSGGLVSKACVEEAIADALRPVGDPRRLDAIVTGPISKESWAMAGFRWPGHTELLAHRTKAKRCVMGFVSPRLRVTLATAHLPLMDVRNVLTIGRVFDPIDLGHELCRDLGIAEPRIAVCGLNPHAGEHGLFGDEEERVIRPAIDVARRGGIDVHGPFPGDTIFIDAAAGKWDLVVAMYHDQGLIPVKLLGWDKAVNVTIGLPIVRTSPDHGTAFNIAGQSKASEGSMKAALDLAIDMARTGAGRLADAG
ncbi:MAG: 4-hydroxythreonine-4-phosphate dehydrogenase PdxA [Phycisphaerales bacterium]|nr:4-hydroxythreonine-4-phosphate dehydrogenase PdxA [Phycisphaerales bacterium]